MGIRPGPDGRPAWAVVLSGCYLKDEAQRLSKTVAAINFVCVIRACGACRQNGTRQQQAGFSR